jgi:hypothetical protein
MKKIFYSWQSDIKPARNKIKKALELAAKQLGDQLEEADRPEIDSDTKGTYGSEDITETIFSKIDSATIFVADVTPIAVTEKKLIPNPNVMAEIGYAIKAKGKWTRLYLYCTDEPVEENKMPFDIRGKSLIGYKMSDSPASIAAQLVPTLEGMLKGAPPASNLKISLLDDQYGWANWSVKNGGVMSGFRYHLRIDNFGGKADYIESIKVVAQDAHADPWHTSYFRFDDTKPNEMYRIEEDKIVDIGVIMTDAPGETQRMMPDLDRDMVKLGVTMRSTGKDIVIPIPIGRLQHR